MINGISSQRRLLPIGYVLNDNDVFCGRGSQCFNHVGNIRFRALVHANLPRYHGSESKLIKSQIIHEVVEYIRSISTHGGFVSKDLETGRYYEIGDNGAREKTSQAFRDATQGKYKSSRLSKAKNARKRIGDQQEPKTTNDPLEPVLSSSDNQFPRLQNTAVDTVETSSALLTETDVFMNRIELLLENDPIFNDVSFYNHFDATERDMRNVSDFKMTNNETINVHEFDNFATSVDAKTFDLLLEFTETNCSF